VVGTIGSAAVGLSFLLTVAIFLEFLKLPEGIHAVEKVMYTWIASGPFKVLGGLPDRPPIPDHAAGGLRGEHPHPIYSIGYMHDDEGFYRLLRLPHLFVFAMLILVSANNFLLMFVGWEGVRSLFLSAHRFWYERSRPRTRGKKAFVVNRIGDFGFLLGVFLIFWTFGSVNFSEVFPLAAKYPWLRRPHRHHPVPVFRATGKSAQIPLYTWLPDAMEGPPRCPP